MPTVPPDGPVVAWFDYGGSDSNGAVWYSVRTAPGAWSTPLLYVDASDTGSGTSGATWPYQTISADVEVVGGKRNVVSYGTPRTVAYGRAFGKPWFVGQGLGATCYPIAVDNIDDSVDVLDNLSYYGMSHGTWRIGGHLYCLLQRTAMSLTDPQWHICMLKAVAFDGSGIPTLWHDCDQSNQPVMRDYLENGCAVQWDGTSSTVDFCVNIAGSATNFGFYTFNTASDTWGSPYGVLNFGRGLQFGPGTFSRGYHGNAIHRYPNGDLGIVYVENTGSFRKVYYRLWTAATSTWGSEVLIVDYSSGPINSPASLMQVIPDESRESLHIFIDYVVSSSPPPVTYAGKYHIVEHSGTVHANLFTFPTTPSAPGHLKGLIYGGNLFVPWSDPTAYGTDVPVWVAPITGGATTFTAELIPHPPPPTSFSAPGPVYLAKVKAAIVIPPGANNRAYIGGFARTV